jgi:C-terminal processing protease CtpA/Prc/Tol biopolymer transport system component
MKQNILPVHALTILLLFLALPLLGQNDTYLRYPALNSDASAMAFSFQGDIWTANIDGSNVKRLTIHEGNDILPQWSPDNRQIAFSSSRYNNHDIYSISATGSLPQRLTYHSSNDLLTSWSSQHGLLFETSRTFKQLERESDLGAVSPQGGTPSRLLDAVGFEPVASPNGKFIAFVRGTCRLAREAYRGAANRDIWLYNTSNQRFLQITDFDGNDFNPDWGDDNTLYFISARSGRYNVHKLKINADGTIDGAPAQLTDFTDYGVMSLDVSRDGTAIAMEQYNKIHLLNTADNSLNQLNIAIGADYRHDPIEHKTFAGKATEYEVSPNGKYLAFVVRGEIFVTANDKEKSRTVQITNNPYRDLDVTWLNDSALIFSSDRNGQFNLFLARSSDPAEHNLFRSIKHEVIRLSKSQTDETNPAIAPNGKQIAYQMGRGKLVVADIDKNGKMSKAKTLLDGWATPSGVAWSPDSRWLAYSLSDLDFNSEIYIHAADNRAKPVNISMHPKGDRSPVWSKDGSKLGFISTRNNGDADVWFVWLKKSDWDKTKQDWQEDEENGDNGDGDKINEKNGKPTATPVQIDFTRIHDRLEQVTALPGNESNLAIGDQGEYFFFVNNNNSRQTYKAERDLHKIKWDGSKLSPLTKKGTAPRSVALGPKGKSLYFIKQGGKLAKVSIDKASVENLPFSAKMDIDHLLEREQMFEEAWRTLNAGFYDPQFHGQDFSRLKAKYKDWAIGASTLTDFRGVFNLMLGQLNASHMGMYGSDEQVEVQSERTGLLGVDIEPATNGVKVLRVVPDTPADRESSKLRAGDIITSVNGVEVGLKNNFYKPLVNTANEKVLLTVTNTSGANREVVIRPTSSIRTALYEEWVQQRRQLTEKYSNGALGYLHIRGMNWTSFEQFERELTASGMGKQGLVIDVRYNGGGWTTDYLMTVLSVRQHAYTIPRGAAADLDKENVNFKKYYPFGERLPLSAWTKPAVAICNANSYSNAEIFSHAFKTLDRGTLVGIPTFGAVISTGGQGLIDGSFVRLPFRAWYVLATGKSMENIPAVPDIIIDNAPDSKAKGVDEQLKKAVETLLAEIN